MALTSLKSLNAEIKILEAQKKLVETRDGEVPKALAILQKYAKVLTQSQRKKVVHIIGEGIEGELAKRDRKAVAGKGLLARRTVAPKYRLPSGETWAGRGLMPRAFAAWAESAEGRAWREKNPDERFPPAETARGKRLGAKPRPKAAVKQSKRRPVAKPDQAINRPPQKTGRKKAAKRAVKSASA